MESVPIGPHSTSLRATSAGPSPPRRNPMEDADSSVTRKRPRLDSGDRTHRSMSADRINTAPSAIEQARASLTPPHTGNLSRSTDKQTILSPTDRTPSKVTINVRDSTQTASPSRPVSDGAHVPHSLGNSEMDISGQAESSSVRIESRSSDVISVNSTPSRSPEIEVADIEDMNGESGKTKWRPLTSLNDAKDTQGALLEAFPFALRTEEPRHTVSLLGQAIEKSKLERCPDVVVLLTLYKIRSMTIRP